MDVTVKSLEDFEKYYQSNYQEVVSQFYERIKSKKGEIIGLRVAIGVILCLLVPTLCETLHLKEILGSRYSVLLYCAYALILLGTFFAIKTSLAKLFQEQSETMIKDIIAFICSKNKDEVMFEPKLMISTEALEKMELFNLDVVKYTGKNYIKAPFFKNNMVFADMKTYTVEIVETKKTIYKKGKKYIRTIRKRKKKTFFEGVYVGATLNKKNTNQIYLIPNNFNDTVLQSKIMSYIKFHGVPVELENLEFSKKYRVFCDDEVQARYILSLGLMERINQLDKLFAGKKYIVFKEGKRFAICLEGVSIREIKNLTLPVFRNEKKEAAILRKMYEKLSRFFEIYDVLDLGNDLYTKYLEK